MAKKPRILHLDDDVVAKVEKYRRACKVGHGLDISKSQAVSMLIYYGMDDPEAQAILSLLKSKKKRAGKK